MKKVLLHIPNAITCLNLSCGALGIAFLFRDRIDIAFWLLIAAAVFDFLDGFAARLLNAYSPLGKELDSLADAISFGLLPAFMLYVVYLPAAPRQWMAFIPFWSYSQRPPRTSCCIFSTSMRLLAGENW